MRLRGVANFLARMVPNRGSGDFGDLLVHRAAELIYAIDQAEEESRLTAIVHHNDGIWITHRGIKLCLIIPAQQHLRLVIGDVEKRPESQKLVSALERGIGAGQTEDTTNENAYRQFRVLKGGIEIIERWIESLERTEVEVSVEDASHPRYFPGELREAAFKLFEKEGRMCPGTGEVKRHHVGTSEPIEYDHILPYSRGGASTAWNLQILCMACNRAKAATAL